jgi:3-dehydroquinate synthase
MLPEHIVITSNPAKELQTFLGRKGYPSVGVLTDENTSKHCYPLLKDSIPAHTRIEIKSGEENKIIESCNQIWEAMTQANLDRHSVLIIIGGGVLCDMGGFCAATYKRGIDFIFVPTTLLAQADASIGGKLGIDFNNFKNQLGVFKEPTLNLLHGGFLKTLPRNELRSGFAEIIKHALIGDVALWNQLKENRLEYQPWEELLKKSSAFKYSVIEKDPLEKGLRKILNAGHTIGHAIETYCLAHGNKVLHGEAIAAGLIAESKLAVDRQLIPSQQLDEICLYILNLYGKIDLRPESFQEIAELCKQDKKNKGNTILAALLNGIGAARWDIEISPDEIVRSLSFYRSL